MKIPSNPLVSISLILFFPLSSGCMSTYLLRQGWGQFLLLNQAKPLNSMATDQMIDPKLRQGVGTMLRALDHAKLLGLKVSGHYSRVTPISGESEAVSYVVQAAYPDKLEPFLWRFPIIGAVPYKGFFDREDAEEEALLLREEGYDLLIRPVTAYSTLGWFDDPLPSPVLTWDEANIVELVLHELAHATIYAPGQPNFNEGMATFIGEMGTEAYLAHHYGESSDPLARYRRQLADDRIMERYVEELYVDLNGFYGEKRSRREKIEGRKELFAAHLNLFRERLDGDPGAEALLGRAARIDNNAELLLHRMYEFDRTLFKDLFQAVDGRWMRFLRLLDRAAGQSDSLAWLRRLT